MPIEMYEQPKNKTMIVEIIKQTMAKGRLVKPGEILELPESEARVLICYNKAKKYESVSVVETIEEEPEDKSMVEKSQKSQKSQKNKGE
ncbi:MAG: hypothetical protein IPP74_10225 [Alphaproteobacteria bacterium]|nr:hypothetical protein [Alphaproteobacteria bacterium]